MKTAVIAILTSILVYSAPAQASTAKNTVVVDVNGMVCDFCAQSLEKVFLKEKGVQKLEISLEHKTMTIHLDVGASIDNATITKLVQYGGYDVANIRR